MSIYFKVVSYHHDYCTHAGCVLLGSYLKQCGLAEVKLGQSLLQYHGRLQREFVTPLKAFVEVDIKNALVSWAVATGNN